MSLLFFKVLAPISSRCVVRCGLNSHNPAPSKRRLFQINPSNRALESLNRFEGLSTNSHKPSLQHSSCLQAELRAQVDNSLDVLHACRPKCATCIFKFCLDFGQFVTKIGRKCSEWTFFDF